MGCNISLNVQYKAETNCERPAIFVLQEYNVGYHFSPITLTITTIITLPHPSPLTPHPPNIALLSTDCLLLLLHVSSAVALSFPVHLCQCAGPIWRILCLRIQKGFQSQGSHHHPHPHPHTLTHPSLSPSSRILLMSFLVMVG